MTTPVPRSTRLLILAAIVALPVLLAAVAWWLLQDAPAPDSTRGPRSEAAGTNDGRESLQNVPAREGEAMPDDGRRRVRSQGGPGEEVREGDVVVTVRHADGSVATGVNVQLLDRSVETMDMATVVAHGRTDASGVATIRCRYATVAAIAQSGDLCGISGGINHRAESSPLEITLADGRRVRGRVVDENGDSLAGIALEVFVMVYEPVPFRRRFQMPAHRTRRDGQIVWTHDATLTVTSGPDGEFDTPLLPVISHQAFTIHIDEPPWLPASVAGRDDEHVEVRLARAQLVKGRVVAADGGTPVTFTVTTSEVSRQLQPDLSSRRFEMLVPGRDSGRLLIESPGMGSRVVAWRADPEKNYVELGTITLEPSVKMTGVIRWPDGEPASHATVRIVATDYVNNGAVSTAGPNGEFQFTTSSGVLYDLSAESARAPDALDMPNVLHAAGTLSSLVGGTEGVELRLEPRRSLVVRFVDAKTQEAMQVPRDARLQIVAGSDEWVSGTLPQGSNAAAWRLEGTGPWTVHLLPEQYESDVVVLHPTEMVIQHTFALRPFGSR